MKNGACHLPSCVGELDETDLDVGTVREPPSYAAALCGLIEALTPGPSPKWRGENARTQARM